ncbi:MAG: PhoU domain-containing protein [Candidatus Methanodesulfokora sp.]
MRTVQLTGRSTYIISLPKEWMEQMGIGKGDKLRLVRKNSEISIYPEEVKLKEEEKVVKVIPEKGSMIRAVLSCYMEGYNRIEITPVKGVFSLGDLEELREFIKRGLIGAEIVMENRNRVVINVLLGPPQLPFSQALMRLYWMVSRMMDYLEELVKGEESVRDAVIKSDDDVDRLCYYLLRQLKLSIKNIKVLKESGLEDLSAAIDYSLVVKFLERISDHVVGIAKVMGKEREGVAEALELSRRIFESAFESISSLNYEKAERTIEESKRMRERLMGLIKDNLLMEHIARISEYSGDIAEIAVDISLRHQ